AVEYTIDHLSKPSTTRILSWLRCQVYQKLEEAHIPISAPSIYQMLLQEKDEMLSSLYTEFYTDDHRYWHFGDKPAPIQQKAKEQWGRIARQTAFQQAQQHGEPEESRQLFATQVRAERSRRSYREFLNKFSILREELHASTDEFDLNFYTYGLHLYGNMPLVEPLETREIKKIQEFVIVIDTSDSTSGNLVKNFLRETFEILHQREQFFSSCKIRILQCDDAVRSDQEITDLNQSERFLNQFTVIGGGGTNFCPAFTYVNQLIEQHVFQNLGGLLYFTDGQGAYPKKRPAYKAAFLFLGDFEEANVPPWAIRLRLEPEEFTSNNHRRHI
ncbi:MAG: metallopeptidase, partial [Eubacterium sp.]|nr:metallopeptidase [Eubacterium sp.]